MIVTAKSPRRGLLAVLQIPLIVVGLCALRMAVGATPTAAQGTWGDLRFEVKGHILTYHALRAQGQMDWMASRTEARGEFTLRKGNASLFASLNATHNARLPELTRLALREGFLSYTSRYVDFRLGRQIIIWGVADALRLNDAICPFDLTEFLAQDYDNIYTPVNALEVKFHYGHFSLEALCIPILSFYTIPTDPRNPWSISYDSPIPYIVDLEQDAPEAKLANSEFGARLSMNLEGADLNLYALRGWNKKPALCPRLDPSHTRMEILGHYRRLTMLGMDIAVPVDRFVLRGEGVANLGEAQSTLLGYELQTRHTLQGLIGVDCYPGADWLLSVQYYHRYILGSASELQDLKSSGLATLRISKGLLQNTLSLSTFAYVDVSNGGLFNRLSIEYALTDDIHLTAGYDLLHGDRGLFAPYRKNSEVWVKFQYNF